MKASLERKPSAKSDRKRGGVEISGMVDEARYSGVRLIPAIIMMAPVPPNTSGTLSAVYPRDARSGHGRASIRGMVGINKRPKGQNNQFEGNKPNAHRERW